MPCAGGLVADEDEKHPPLNHPSHPQHQLRFSKKTSQGWCSPCDACGTTEKGSSYICTICDYWIHDTCALLLPSARFPSHHHSLSLSFYLPYEYSKYEFNCAICSGPLRLRHWVYHCYLCRYVIHLNCTSSVKKESNNKNAVNDEKGITKSPMDNIYEEIIRAFVKRESGEIVTPYDTRKYKFNNHSHLLSFIIFSDPSSCHDHNEEDDDDDDDDGIIRISGLRCDGCTLPIDENDESEKGYMSCDECKYFLHLSCFNLPPQIPSHPLHPDKDHNLELRNASKLTDWAYCDICEIGTNGLFYKCTKCYFKLDIKCASLPNIIKHAAHPRHYHLKLISDTSMYAFCSLCYSTIYKGEGFYKCDGCIFSVCGDCVLLPARNKHGLEKHLLELTYDAYVSHSGDFYCSSCEEKMNPKMRMYYCRDCDQSFHPECFPATSGWYRNINFGKKQYVIPTLHDPHHPPLIFQIITKKKRCNLCHEDKYDDPGFQCVSCNFVMCLESCGRERMSAIKAI